MISVIVPYLRDRGYLGQCVRSIEAQTYRDFEIVLSQSDGSLPVNFNNGLRRAKGEFIKMVQDDDWLPEDSLETLVTYIHESPWIIGQVWQECANPYIYEPAYLDFKRNVEHYVIHMGSTMYRKSVLEAVGGMDESLLTGEEYDMHLKILQSGYEPAYIAKPVYHYRMWTGGKSVQFRRKRTQWRKDELAKIRSRYTDKV